MIGDQVVLVLGALGLGCVLFAIAAGTVAMWTGRDRR